MSINLERPNIIVPVTDAPSFHAVGEAGARGAPPPWDCVELRLDLFAPPRRALPVPVLLTPRHPDEGGEAHCAGPARRAALCRPWLRFASAIDIEIAHAAEMSDLLAEARREGLLKVLSFHDFAATPGIGELEDRVRAGLDHGADVVKMATRTDTPADVERLLGLFDVFPRQPLALMGMGEEGKASRLAAARRGSVLNYAAIETPTVEGQWQASEFRERLASGAP